MIRRAVLVLLMLVVSAGCAPAVAPPSTVVPGATPTTASDPVASGSPSASVDVQLAPRVSAPRDARGIPACDLLTPAQRAELEIDPATQTTSAQNGAHHCRWQVLDGAGSLQVTSATEFPVGGLEGLYLVRDPFGVFEPGELDGHPIVRADLEDSGDRTCTIYVGVADDQLIWATADFPFDRSACTVARQMASFMIANLPPLR